jgi:hypothetical protein
MDVFLVPGSPEPVKFVATIVWATAPCATRSTHAANQKRMGRNCLAMSVVVQDGCGGVQFGRYELERLAIASGGFK